MVCANALTFLDGKICTIHYDDDGDDDDDDDDCCCSYYCMRWTGVQGCGTFCCLTTVSINHNF